MQNDFIYLSANSIFAQIAAIIFLLYLKLGISAIMGAICCILIVTPMQLVLGKRMSENSKYIAVRKNRLCSSIYSCITRSNIALH